jgi:putative transposase
VLYGFFVISHGRRNILHFNVNIPPVLGSCSNCEAFPEDRAPQYLILDRDVKFSGEVATTLEYLGTAYPSPRQNGAAERWVGSCRRELLDHVIVLNESHLRRLVRDYLQYYHDDRLHDALKKETPTPEWSNAGPAGPPRSRECPASAACIIAINGKPPREVLARPASAAVPCQSREVQIQKRQGIEI